jgi:hypothetical protein
LAEYSERERGKAALVEMREQLSRILGVTAVDMMIERAALEVVHTYPAMSLIRLSEHALEFDAMDAALQAKSDEEVRASFGALSGVIVLIMARLIGKDATARLLPPKGADDLLGGMLT